ncbi:DsrE family protein, partial [Providencia stuartii]|uniref:DsrE family protein n=1 Tax=Providencia stuartii TaxID=588 RepID=UPI003AAAC098
MPTNREAYSSLEFARSVLKEGHELLSIFFYREGVYNANQLTAPARDEFYLVR